MGLLAEYAITPGVFEDTSYPNSVVGDLYLQSLKATLLESGIVRNLRDGQWRSLFSDESRPWHPKGRELVKKLALQGRLVSEPRALPALPVDEAGWLAEAEASRAARGMAGIITAYSDRPPRSPSLDSAPVNHLSRARWWSSRACSVRVPRTIEGYRCALDLVLRSANSIMFIDPHLDPSKSRYSNFAEILSSAAGRKPAPAIEVHRATERSELDRVNITNNEEWEVRFRKALGSSLWKTGLSIEVFIWKDDGFHDRYVISNVLGILAGNGFDTTTRTAPTTWARLSREDRDAVQREFDPAGRANKLQHRFQVP
jgi:hypothetical protein